MKNLIIGLIIGLTLGGGIVFASSRYFSLQDSTGNAITSANPLSIANN